MVDNTFRTSLSQLTPPPRLLCGPGPGNADPRVLSAIGLRQVGHLDPFFINLMNEIKELLKYAWQTKNDFTIPMSGTGSAAMEACFANLVEKDDVVLIFQNGYFGIRMEDMATRLGAKCVVVKTAWGNVFSEEEIKTEIEKHKPALTCLVHAETSTGACQPVENIGEICHKNNSLLLIDTVTSLGGVPLFLDDWGVDAAYSGSQKCLSCPPGIAPLTFSSRAMEKLKNRKSAVPNWYLDLSMLANYWGGGKRSYHHTAPINMNYALREALRCLAEEGLEERWKRHANIGQLFYKGLEEIGLKCHVESEYRLPELTTVVVPDGIDAAKVTKHLLDNFNIEVGGGLGELAGKVWRVGLMGFNARPEVVLTLIAAFSDALKVQGYQKPKL